MVLHFHRLSSNTFWCFAVRRAHGWHRLGFAPTPSKYVVMPALRLDPVADPDRVRYAARLQCRSHDHLLAVLLLSLDLWQEHRVPLLWCRRGDCLARVELSMVHS